MMKTILVLLIINVAANIVATSDIVWQVDSIVSGVEIVALCYLSATLCHERLSLWCVIVAYGACQVVETLSNGAYYAFGLYNLYFDGMRVTVAVGAVLYYLFRRYDVASCPITEGEMYLTYHKPDGLQDRLLSLVGTPLGGVGLYVGGAWYRYRRGVFICQVSQPNKNHVIMHLNKYDSLVESQIKTLVGTKWTLLNNCITEVRPVARNGKRLPLIPTPR